MSFDIQNLFPSIPLYEVIELVDSMLTTNNVNVLIKEDILEVCLDQNYFRFNDTTYLSKEGLIMGYPLSPLLAEIFMDNLEKNILNHPFGKYFIYWHRYVDDILVCYTGTDRLLDQFVNYINNLHPNINFTVVKEINHKIF